MDDTATMARKAGFMENVSMQGGGAAAADLIDHATVDVDVVIGSPDLTEEQKIGLEAMAAVISFGYRDEDGAGFDEALMMARRWDIASVLLGPDWNDPEVAAAIEDGADPARVELASARQRDLLLAQAAWVGRHLSRVILVT